MKDKIVVIGGGGHARVLISNLKKLDNYEILGYTDLTNKGSIAGVKYLGDDNVLKDIINTYDNCKAVIGVGCISVSKKRENLYSMLKAYGFELPSIISKYAIVSEEVSIDEGTVVFEGVVINVNTVVGKCAIINTSTVIESDSSIGNFVHVAPGSRISRGVIIHKNAFIGSGAIITQNITISENCLIASGSVVTTNIFIEGTYIGVPATRISKSIKPIFSKSKVLSLCQQVEWSLYLNKLPKSKQDVYYSPEYYNIYERNGDGKAQCFIFEDGGDIAIYPFLINRINDLGYDLDKDYFDIQGAYGYNGVTSSSEDQSFVNNFYDAFNNFCISHNIIAEFTRFNPLLNNNTFSQNFLNVSFNRDTVYVDLTSSYEHIHNNYKRDVRANIRTAQNNNLSVVPYKIEYPYKKVFIEMYFESMNSLNACKYLYFNKEFFDNTFTKLPLIQFVVLKSNTPIASMICIYNNNYLHAHLLGSRKEYLSYRPINMLFDQVIKYGVINGFHKLHLGGGRTTAENDSLLLFKKKHSKTTLEYYIGHKIYNVAIYESVCAQWSKKHPHLKNKHACTILKYRFTE